MIFRIVATAGRPSGGRVDRSRNLFQTLARPLAAYWSGEDPRRRGASQSAGIVGWERSNFVAVGDKRADIGL
jgi:hypothetical protein